MIHTLNDSQRQRIVVRTLSVANALVAAASGAFGVIAAANPPAVFGAPVGTDAATGFFVDMYAVRAITVAGGLVVASATMSRTPRTAALALLGGGVIQLGDVVIAARFGTPGVVGAAIAAVVHVGTAVALLRARRTAR